MISQIRSQELLKIQQKTSEDLHDDLGNKITRISVLTDILQNKIDRSDTDNQKLLAQIKENVSALYLGTKDIIWSLMPGSDNLGGVLDRIQAFGIALFEDTGFEFNVRGQRDWHRKIKLPADTGRNLVLILKEALNNILKHSEGTKANVSIEVSESSGSPKFPIPIDVTISDNGKGINRTSKAAGSGLENIRKRIERINGNFHIDSSAEKGTVLRISVKIPSNEG